MKHYLKTLIITIISFYIAYSLVPTIQLGSDPQNILVVIGSLLLTSLVIHPIFSIILLPINILTFGLLSLILNIALFLALTKFLPGFGISPYDFPGTNIGGFIIPAAKLTQTSSILAVAAIVTFTQKILQFIFE